jgi:formylglycine-generating enzyme required for sulfatase activity
MKKVLFLLIYFAVFSTLCFARRGVDPSFRPFDDEEVVSTESSGSLSSDKVWKDPYLGMEFVWVSGGCFSGSAFGHKVCVSGFWMSKYEVTFSQFDRFFSEVMQPKLEDECLFCQTGNCVKNCEYEADALHRDEGWGRGERPAINVSWYDALAFAEWLSKKTGRVFRLPTEAEWEYACSACGATQYGTKGGQLSSKLAKYSSTNRMRGPGSDDNPFATSIVGSFPANALGLYDMSGNVWEWCLDAFSGPGVGGTWRSRLSKDILDPLVTEDGLKSIGGNPSKLLKSLVRKRSKTSRVIKGGGWDSNASYLACSAQDHMFSTAKRNNTGFRLVMIPKE